MENLTGELKSFSSSIYTSLNSVLLPMKHRAQAVKRLGDRSVRSEAARLDHDVTVLQRVGHRSNGNQRWTQPT